MKKVDFNKLQAGDLVEVPRTQFAPMRSGRRAGNHFVYAGYLVQRKEQRASNRRTGSSADAAGRAAGY